VLVKNPIFGNTWSLDLGVQIEHAAGGTLLQFADSHRPIIRKMQITIANMTGVQKAGIENLIVNSVGEELVLDDGEGRVWKGVFLTDPLEFHRTGRGCRWQTELEFEGYITDPIKERDNP
jgi:hypothetical protein